MNRRTLEFAEEVSNLLCLIRDLAMYRAEQKNVSAYDVELDIEEILMLHMTNRMIATKMCALRHFDNLKNRDLFIFGRETLRLNPKFADKDIDLLIHPVKMPKNEAVA